MKGTLLDVHPSFSAMPHRIYGTRIVDAAVSSIEIQMHRYVELEHWSLRSASNAFWRLYWPMKRGGVITFNGAEYVLEPGWLYLISPHTPFDSRCNQPFAKWYVHFSVGGLSDGIRPAVVRLRPTVRMRSALDRACPKPRRARPSMKAPASPLDALELALLAIQHALPQFQLSPQANPRLPACVDYLREHLRDKVTLADLARHSACSSRALSHMFVTELGFPPMRYLIELRLNHAMKLLRHTDHAIEQIAEECGFPNRYYLTRMLSKYRKTTPAMFRADARKAA